jgi:regulator of sirC expression with transglutaminase-like and TPR domain
LKNSVDNPARNAGPEFESLAGQMKNNLSAMIEQEQYAQALPVMQQLCELLPEDLELLKLRQRFYQKMDNHK